MVIDKKKHSDKPRLNQGSSQVPHPRGRVLRMATEWKRETALLL
jgi:hypothetical protein